MSGAPADPGGTPGAGAGGRVPPTRAGRAAGAARTDLPSQVDATTCGIASLAAVAARAGTAPAYLDAPRAVQARVQEDLHAIAARTGLPWPRSLGTSPWALALLAHRGVGGTWVVLPWGARARAGLLDAVRAGSDAFLCVGGGPGALAPALAGRLGALPGVGPALRRGALRVADLVPRHVVAVLAGAPAGTVRLFEPSSGAVTDQPANLLDGPWDSPRREFGFWARPLLVVVPVPGCGTPDHHTDTRTIPGGPRGQEGHGHDDPQ